MKMMGYGNSHEGYYRQREKRSLRAVSNSSKTITEKKMGAIETWVKSLWEGQVVEGSVERQYVRWDNHVVTRL